MMTTDTFPLLKTSEGCLQQSSAISCYLASLAGGKMLGTNAVERSQVDQWISFANSTIAPCATVVSQGIFGECEIMQDTWNAAMKDLKTHLKTIDNALKDKKWLVGSEMTVADVYMAITLMLNFQTTLDGGFRKAMKNVNSWAEACFANASVKKVFGAVQMCAKPLKPLCTVAKKEVKKAAPAQAVKKVVEEKKKDNVESLPPSPWVVYDFKTFYVNHEDKKGAAVDTWMKELDWAGWSFWHFHYEKFGTEGSKLHVTNNMLGGFLSRAEHINKIAFARMGVFGEEPNLEIMGVWLMRGTEVPDGFKDHPQFEYYKVRKMDPRKVAEDLKMVREYFGSVEEEMVMGMKAQTLKYVK
jgi:elongation factor 1-gamma